MASYVAAKGSHITNNDAVVFGTHFEQLAQSGPVTPKAVVDAARPVDSPTHRYYEWDNEIAGEEYRLDQARYYLRSVEIVISHNDADEEPVRAFHNVTMVETEERGYLHINTIRNESALMSQVIETAKGELVNWQRRYRQYDALKPSLTLVDEAIQQLVLPQVAAEQV